MGWIKGAIVCFCIPFLTLHWSNEVFAAPKSSSSSSKSSPFGLIYKNPIRTIPEPVECSTVKRQELLSQASILLKKLSTSESEDPVINKPSECTTDDLETILIQDLIDRLEALEKINTQVANPSKKPLIISEVTYKSIVDQYRNIVILADESLAKREALIVKSSLYDVYATFNKIISEPVPNAELPSLCSKILALNTQLEATGVSKKLKARVTDLIESLTSALTGQNQVTISEICNCLNDLETSVVTVVQNDKSERLKTLLTNLVNAVINAVVSTNDSCDVVEIVQNYVASINEAIKQDAKSRAGKIYSSVLNFEEELSKVLIQSGEKKSQPLSDVPKLSSKGDTSTDPQDTHDVTSIVSNGALFIINEHVVKLMDEDDNIVEVVRRGIFKLVDPTTNISYSGSYAVQEGTIDSNPDGSITIANSVIFDVNLPEIVSTSSPVPRVKMQGYLSLQDNIVVNTDKQGNSKRTEGGNYVITDPITGKTKRGNFAVEHTISELNSDNSINVIKAGVLTDYGTYTFDDEDAYFLSHEYIYSTPNKNGDLGSGLYSMKTLPKFVTESGNYVIRQLSVTENIDGSTNTITSGLLYVDNLKEIYFTLDAHQDSVTDKYGHVTAIARGQLTRTDPKTLKRTFKNYVLPNIIITNNPDGSKNIIKFGKFVTNGDSTLSTNPTTKPILVSKNSFQALLNDLKLTGPIPSQTDPTHKPPVQLCADVPSKSAIILPKYNATSIVTDGTAFIIREYITQLLDSKGKVFKIVELGTYWFRDEKTNIAWYGAFETTSFSLETDSPNKVNTTKVGKFEIASPPFSGLCDPHVPTVEGLFSINDYVVRGNKGSTLTENGRYNLTDITMNDTKSGSFVVLNNVTRILESGVIEIVKTGFLMVDEPKTKKPMTNCSLKECGRYFLFKDHESKDPEADGNQGTGVFSIKDSTTNHYSLGTYVIEERTMTTNLDGTTDLTTIGVIYVSKSTFDTTSSSSNRAINIANGAKFTSVDHLTTTTDVYGHTSTHGTGTFTQIDPKTGAVQSATFEVKNVVTTTDDDGTQTTLKFGRVPDGAYTGESTSSTAPETGVTDDKIFFTLEDHIFGIPRSDGTYGTGEYKFEYPSRGESVVGTYDIKKQSTVTGPNGKVNRTTSGVIHVDDSLSSSTISDPRLVILDGAQYTLEEIVTYSKDAKNNIIANGTGRFTQTITSTRFGISTDYTINEYNTEFHFNGAQDIIRSGVMGHLSTISINNDPTDPSSSSPAVSSASKPSIGKNVEKSNIPKGEDDEVYVSFTDLLLLAPDTDGNDGTGDFKIEKLSTGEFVTGTYIIQQQSSIGHSNGTVNRKTSGVISLTSSVLSSFNTDWKLTILDGSYYMLEETVSYSRDADDNVIVTGTGLLTQTDPNSGVVVFTHYAINTFDASCDANGIQNISRSGTIENVEAIASKGNTAVPSKTPTPKPTSGAPSTSIIANDNVFFTFKEHLLAKANSGGSYGRGEYIIEYPSRGESVAGIYVIKERSTVAGPHGKVSRKTSGVIHVDDFFPSSTISDPRLVILDGAQYTLEETITYSKDVKNNVIATGHGKFTQLMPSTGLVISTNYTIKQYNTECSSDDAQDIVRSGTLDSPSRIDVIKSSTKPSSSSSVSSSAPNTPNVKNTDAALKIPTSKNDEVYCSFKDNFFNVPDNDGNYGAGEFNIKKSSSGEFVVGTYIIRGHSSIGNLDGTITWKTSGMIFVDSSQSRSFNVDPKLAIMDGVEYTQEETVSYSTDMFNHLFTTGTGVLTLTNRKTATITSTYYTINMFDVRTNDDGLKTIIRSGVIDFTTALAYLTLKPTSPVVPETKVGTNYVTLSRADVISALEGNNLQPGDAVIIQTNNGNALLAAIDDSEDPVTFYVTDLADVVKTFATTPNVWPVSEDQFSERDRRLIDLVSKGLPCDS